MKKLRKSVLSLLLIWSLCLSLCLPAMAAGGPPYSQSYLQGVSGLTYQAVLEISPTDIGLDGETAANTSQVTMEAYTIDNSLSWNEAVGAAQRALESNGFQRDTENTANLWMDKALPNGFESFIIADLEMTQAVFDTARFGNTLLLIHMRYTDPGAGQTETPAQTPAGLSNFTRSVPYTPGQFDDVGSGAWYASAVQSACEYGLMSGHLRRGQPDHRPDPCHRLPSPRHLPRRRPQLCRHRRSLVSALCGLCRGQRHLLYLRRL